MVNIKKRIILQRLLNDSHVNDPTQIACPKLERLRSGNQKKKDYNCKHAERKNLTTQCVFIKSNFFERMYNQSSN